MNEEDAQTAALQEYFDSNTPAGYGASFRAGWEAGRLYGATHAPGWTTLIDQRDRLERLLDRAYPLLHNPYTQQSDPLLATTYNQIIREVERAIAHLFKDEDDPERVELPCASCDGDGCPNCAIDAILRAEAER
jgi:hypothetical protein